VKPNADIRTRTALSAAGLAAVVAAGSLSATPATGAARPRLLVLLSVDQMRADYVTRYGHQWTAGLRRLLDRGAWFSQAAYPYLNTVTCAGHATIGTGAFPATHGLILNQWWDREAGRSTACTSDASAALITYARPAEGGDSASRLEVPTFADELRAQSATPPHIVSLSGKARATITLAGHRGDVVLWFDGPGGWTTSTAFARARLPFLERYFAEHPVDADAGRVWDRMLPPSAYLFDDDGAGERGLGGRATFPYTLGTRGSAPDKAFYDAWESSPFFDAYLGRLAAALAAELKMGQGPGTDYLAVSFSALDPVGHDHGPRSHEVQDVLARLDRTIGRLLGALDHLVGPGRYVVALTADHGVSPIPEQVTALGEEAGRLNLKELSAQVNATLAAHLGPGTYVAAWNYTDLYFTSGTWDRLAAAPAALATVVHLLERTPGILRVMRGDELRRSAAGDDALARAAALSHRPGRSGDLIVVPRPYWITSTAITTHGTAHRYDARVPVLLAGAGIRPGEYLAAASPADIAVTFAHLTGVTLPRPDGRVLEEALVRRALTPATGGTQN